MLALICKVFYTFFVHISRDHMLSYSESYIGKYM